MQNIKYKDSGKSAIISAKLTEDEKRLLTLLSVRWGKPPDELFKIAIQGMLAAGREYLPPSSILSK
jgi:hypothetical protein